MKRILFASTAMVAATMLSAGAASAAEKIKLNLGGYSKWWVVGQFNDDKYTRGATQDINSVDLKGDNEVYFGGSTTLDNGMKVGIQVQLEAGGHTDGTTDTIDESYVFVETGFGKFIVGSENNGTYLLHVTAPDAAGNWSDGGMMTGGYSVAAPSNVMGITPSTGAPGDSNTTAIVTDGDTDKITYVAPTFYGLTVGGSYAPNSTQDNRGITDLDSSTTGEIFGVGALYANTFGGVGVKVSAGWATYDIAGGGSTATSTGDSTVNEYSTGAQIAYAGFTLGGSYRQVDGYRQTTTQVEDTFDAKAWDVGVQYASGPYAVSLAYYRSEAVGNTSIAGDDKMEFIQLSGKYALGAGVDVLASVGKATYDDETAEATNPANHNEGYAVMTGLSLSF